MRVSNRVRSASALALVAVLGLSACGGPSADGIAAETCDLLEGIDLEQMLGDAMEGAMSGDGEETSVPEEMKELEKRGKELEKQAKDAGISDEAIAKAMKKECGDLVKQFEDLGEG